MLFRCSKTQKLSLDSNNIPQHVAVIMDGNGRWAKRRGWQRIVGHRNGLESVRDIISESIRYGVKYLTLFAFSTENWSRPKSEVDELLNILLNTFDKELPTLKSEGVKIKVIGDISTFPATIQNKILAAEKETQNNGKLYLNIAMNYSGRWEITQMVKKIIEKHSTKLLTIESINETLVESMLCDNQFPPPDLLIRTSGELRISNFLLWQIAYTELYFTKTLWPDFRKEEYHKAIKDYQQRQRRFGKIT